ncbi:Transmembrane domain-containing protein [Spironucleus salmonicida]|uniref:Transmembrane domain-containing protein n=1 Tax=Spironucleus salmonicida TaxID=348837 RepID=V6LEP4_9EUKA|nr:Transmembrane domain-containing protein [Spironucleus salmonicida]|eukprot:EST42728.1 Transmembrane domain-containing protein [Spironucleus salmonicida]
MDAYIENRSKSKPLRLSVAIIAVVIDVIICMAIGVAMIFFYFLLLGLSKRNMLLYAPSIATEVAVHQVFFYPCVTGYPKIKEWCSRHSHLVVFSTYFSILVVTATVSIFVQSFIFDCVFYTRVDAAGQVLFTLPPYGAFIGTHQVITFVVITSHTVLANFHFLKEMDPFAAGVCAEIWTWGIWGVWIGRALSPVSNLAQIAGYMQWIPIVNLMGHGIFRNADFSGFRSDMSKFGILFVGIQVPVALCTLIGWLFHRYVIFRSLPNVGANPQLVGHSVWGMAALSWLPFQITGNRLAPIFYDEFCLTPLRKNRWLRMFVWMLIFIVLATPLLIAFYVYFQQILYNILIVNVLKCTDYQGGALTTDLSDWPTRPAYFLGFGVGIAYAVWFEALHISRSSMLKESHEQDIQSISRPDIEQNGLEPTQGNISKYIHRAQN